MHKVVLSFSIALVSINSSADGLNDLEKFLTSTQSGSAGFTQTVTSPARTGEAAPRAKPSSGRFEFLRPDRFRFDYKKPFEQTIVADGQTLWLLDVDLNQVTARKQASVLGSTPAALIASAADIKALQVDFVLTNAADKDDLEWVLATPKANSASRIW